MSDFDTIIRGGRISTAADTFYCDIGIREGRIAALGEKLGSADEIIEAETNLNAEQVLFETGRSA